MPSPTSSSSTSSVGETSSLTINALISGDKWGGVTGTGVTLTYSFPWTSLGTATFAGHNGIGNYSSLNEQNATYHYGLDTTEQAAARSALQSWANVANIKFSEVADTSSNVGDIRFAWTSASNLTSTNKQAWGWAGYPDSYWPNAGDVWISTLASGATDPHWSAGSYNFSSLIHELGHTLGLKHPFEVSAGNPTILSSGWDCRVFTLMSYTNVPEYPNITDFTFNPTTPMLLDILAIQAIYGPNYGCNAGNTTYQFNDNWGQYYFQTIWDGGGVNTISYTGNTSSTIDLRQGYGSQIGNAVYGNDANGNHIRTINNVWIAYGTNIQNAVVSGYGNNTLIANNLGDSLVGGQGNDTFVCGAGKDTVDGGAGSDTAVYTGNASGYSIASFDGKTYVLGGLGGNDTLLSVESLTFDDRTIAAPASKSILQYVASYPDLINTLGTDRSAALDHYVNYGYKEGRSATFNTAQYLANYADLSAAFGSNQEAAVTHYIQSGYTEGRTDLQLVFNGAAGNDTLVGNAANNTLYGLGGNDAINGGAGNDTVCGGGGADNLDGAAGIDTALYSGARNNFTITQNASGFLIADNSSAEGTDTLINIERLQFSDKKIALDLGVNQAAANTVQIIAAAFGANNVKAHPEWVGNGLRFFDSGMNIEQVCAVVIPMLGLTKSDFVRTVYQNVVGVAPTSEVQLHYVGLLQGGGGNMSQAELLMHASIDPANVQHIISLIGLPQGGIEYV